VKFADFQVGQIIEAGPYRLSESEVLTFARAYDPQWFHADPDLAAQGPFGGLIASGWHTCAIAMRLVADAALAGSESFASPGLQYVKWPHPVRPLDTLRLEAEVIDVRVSRKRPSLGILEWKWCLFNQEAICVLDLQATSLFKLDPP
jgi:acyl dehydratase